MNKELENSFPEGMSRAASFVAVAPAERHHTHFGVTVTTMTSAHWSDDRAVRLYDGRSYQYAVDIKS